MPTIPITIITGFLGAGKTTLILNLVSQLRAASPDYRIALIKNEFGDVAVDSQLATASAVSGVRELLGGCICCNLVGSLGAALDEITTTLSSSSSSSTTPQPPDRVIIETSGSAFPATLALEVNRLARETPGRYMLDGVVSIIDVENWRGYEDTSYTARVQARYTDLIVYNKWEGCSELRLDECRDRVGDLDVDVAWVKSDRGWVDMEVVFGIDGVLARGLVVDGHLGHSHSHDHQSEVDVLSVTLTGAAAATVALEGLEKLLTSAPRDEVYRIKGVLCAGKMPRDSDGNNDSYQGDQSPGRFVLNWAFGRWKFTRLDNEAALSDDEAVLRLTIICARYESDKWSKKLLGGGLLELDGGGGGGDLVVKKIS